MASTNEEPAHITPLEFARLRTGMKQNELAERVGITPRALRDLEKGRSELSGERLSGLSRELGFSEAFLIGEAVELPRMEAISFRSLARMTAETRNAALSASVFGFGVSKWMDSKFNSLPEVDLLDLKDCAPRQAAAQLRAHWNIGDRPIKNLIGHAETKGVRIFSLEEASQDIDAYCFWRDGTPFVFLNTVKSAEHSRFDLAHELGHLVMHYDGENKGKEAESQANDFASAFLMPTSDVSKYAPRNPTMQKLIQAKKRWGVSLVALIYRMHQIKMLSPWQYRQLMVEASKKGYRTNEPDPMEHESSLLLTKVMEAMRSKGLTLQDIAKDLGGIPREEIEKLFLRLAVVPIEGGQQGPSASPALERFDLRVIEGGRQSI